MPLKKIIVIDDDTDICLMLDRFLSKNGYNVATAHKGADGLKLLEKRDADLLLTDFKLGDMNGSQLVQEAKKLQPELPIVVITGYSDIKVAIQVMKLGALDYVTKPLFPDEILLTVQKALDSVVTKVSKASKKSAGANIIFGNSPASKNLVKQMQLVAPTNYSVIIYGESGAGKEAIAREIHSQSKRKNGPFVAMDCGAISKDLAGSELFGHEKGSFTGAIQQKIGHFEMANGGTLFLDEVANLSYEVQVSLLRVVQERKVRRIGGNKEIETDVRIIVASNERLSEVIKEGSFREDLYYRFNEFSIDVPPLRDRKEDIMIYANLFLDQTNQELQKEIRGFSDEVTSRFLNYPWHGNLRELNNVVKRAALLTDKEYVETSALPFELLHHQKVHFTENQGHEITLPMNSSKELNLKDVAKEAEYQMILDALRKVNFNRTKAAELLQIDRKTLYNKMKKMNL